MQLSATVSLATANQAEPGQRPKHLCLYICLVGATNLRISVHPFLLSAVLSIGINFVKEKAFFDYVVLKYNFYKLYNHNVVVRHAICLVHYQYRNKVSVHPFLLSAVLSMGINFVKEKAFFDYVVLKYNFYKLYNW